MTPRSPENVAAERPLKFGHPARVIDQWRKRVRQAIVAGAKTPFYLFSPEPVAARLAVMDRLKWGCPAVHWYSTKTQPLEPQLRWWQAQDRPAEVVSALELQMVRRCGFRVDQILVNGPAKHHWLPDLAEARMRVNFDSPAELAALLPRALRQHWRVGIRLLTNAEFDPDRPESPTQFGFTPEEAVQAIRRLKKAGIEPQVLHFHLRTNLSDPSNHRQALAQAAQFCQAAAWWPRHLDVGGGLPPPRSCGEVRCSRRYR